MIWYNTIFPSLAPTQAELSRRIGDHEEATAAVKVAVCWCGERDLLPLTSQPIGLAGQLRGAQLPVLFIAPCELWH